MNMDCTVPEFCTADPELSSVLSVATNSLNLENPMTAEKFLQFDDDTPATEELSENWEDVLKMDIRIRLLLKKTMKTLTRSLKNKSQYSN